jgi:hypothetical protein
MEIRRLLDKFFDTKGFTDKQLLILWEKSTLKDSYLGRKAFDEIRGSA